MIFQLFTTYPQLFLQRSPRHKPTFINNDCHDTFTRPNRKYGPRFSCTYLLKFGLSVSIPHTLGVLARIEGLRSGHLDPGIRFLGQSFESYRQLWYAYGGYSLAQFINLRSLQVV